MNEKNLHSADGHTKMQEFKDLIKNLNGTFLIVKAKLFSALNKANQLYIGNKDKIKNTKKTGDKLHQFFQFVEKAPV